MNDWTDEEQTTLLILLDRLTTELKRMNDVMVEVERRSTRTYVEVDSTGYERLTVRCFTNKEREDYETEQEKRPESDRYHLEGIPDRVEDRLRIGK